MNNFQYKARDKEGQLIRGSMGSETAQMVAAKLETMGYLPVEITIATNSSHNLESFWQRWAKVRFADLNFFTRQLFTLQRAGLPLLGSLIAIKTQSSNITLRKSLEQMIRDIEAGSTLSDAMAQHTAIFNPLYVSMVKTGEISGRLPEILNRLTVLGESEERIQIRLKSAVRYPLIVVFTIFAGFFALITLVVPRFVSLYSQFKTALPWPTQVLITLNYVSTHFWWLLLLGLAGLVYAFGLYIKNPVGRRQWDGFSLKVPIFGPLITKMIISRFCRIVGILMKSGVSILQILELARETVGNVIFAGVISNISQSVSEGKGMLEPMRECGLFSPVVLQMVSVGEETAKLDELLIHVADYYDSQIEFTIDNMVSLIEPILIFVLGLAVLFMALGIFLPMWGMMKLFQQ